MRISEVRHQARAHRILQRARHARRVPHAYIFHGPPGVGREMLAVRFARVLLCHDLADADGFDLGDGLPFQPVDGCGQCQSCRLVHADTHPDLHRIYRQLNAYHSDSAVRNRKALDLSVDVIRQFLIAKAATKPVEGHAKVFIVRDADLCTNAAQNALLKTLEEPPPGTFIILITGSLDRLLPTTRSRCQPVSFGPLPREFVAEQLRDRFGDLPEPAARFLAEFSQGQCGAALQHASDQLFDLKQAWGERLADLADRSGQDLARQLQDDAKQLAQKHRQRTPDASETDATRSGLRTLLAVAAAFYRDVLHAHAGRTEALANADQPNVIEALARQFDSERARRAIRLIALAESRINRNANVTLTAETLFTRLARLP